MVRRKSKWKFGIIFYILIISVFTKSLPIDKKIPVTIASGNDYIDLELRSQIEEITDVVTEIIEDATMEQNLTRNQTTMLEIGDTNCTEIGQNNSNLYTRFSQRQLLRPGQEVGRYAVEITVDNGVCRGRAIINLRLMSDIEEPMKLYCDDLDILSVEVGIVAESAVPFDFFVEDGILEISRPEGQNPPSTSNVIIIQYNIPIRNDGTGIFESNFNGRRYLGMNLYPTHARRVFPCVDELTEMATVSFTFNNFNFVNIASNSLLEENNATHSVFRALNTPLHLWGMIAHDFNTVVLPATNVRLFGRPGLNQEAQASTAIQHFFNTLNEWTEKPYFATIVNQDSQLSIVAISENSVQWNALSTICIWEPYVYMHNNDHSIKQRYTAFTKLAEALARQWFGFVVFPQNWRHQWVLTGLTIYAAYDVVNSFQTDPSGNNVDLLDMDTLFVTEVIQESLLRDAYRSATPLIPENDIFEVNDIRGHIHGLIKYKSPAVFRMLRLILGDMETDYIQLAAQIILTRWALEPVDRQTLLDALNVVWLDEPNKMIGDIEEYIEPWTQTRGYPLVHVGLRQGGILVTQEHFSFTATSQQNYIVPLSYTTSIDMNFDNIRPVAMMDNTLTMTMSLDEEDFVLFNIQGQGYYRVNYDNDLWERIIEALGDPEQRQKIHPLNRATLIDDALNLARAGKLAYDTAFRVVLTMENDSDYAPWRAFVRNMDFLRKRLVALITEDEDLDPDIYLRMVRRAIGAFESEIGFNPEPNILEPAMTSLTRGLVMDHACRANYQPCIAAALDLFYDPNNNDPVVNPNIPSDIRPAVYCTTVREGDAQVVNALNARLEIEPVHYERVVILESLACSRDGSFINSLLLETIAAESRYAVEERFRIIKAVAESSYENARRVINFMRTRTTEVRNNIGGSQKLEELIWIIADNAANADLTNELQIWVQSTTNNLDDSEVIAQTMFLVAQENLIWDQTLRQAVYEWIDENDAPRIVVSLSLIIVTFFVTLFNH